ncbi:MAG: amidase [Chloroflexota bacterium]
MNPWSLENASIADLRRSLLERRVTIRALTERYIDRVHRLDWDGPTLRSVIEINPDALEIAGALDEELRTRGPRGPLHGIPILLKDNIDTADRMQTSAGSLALEGSHAGNDAGVARGLREAGAVLLGKANMSEWANFRSPHSSSGWSARGGQCRNPYALDRTPSGSSSGSAAAVAADLVTASIGTETDGSIISPASACGVVGIKPTVGLTSRAGVIPVSRTQDTVGVFGRSVADAATLLGVVTGSDEWDAATRDRDRVAHRDYTRYLGLSMEGMRIGIPREIYFSYSPKGTQVAEIAIEVLRGLGASIVDPADITSGHEIETSEAERVILLHEFKAGLNQYLATRSAPGITSLQDVIDFNERHADRELQYFGQETLIMASQCGGLDEPAYLEALRTTRRLSRDEGIDAVMDRYELDVLLMPSGSPAIKIDLVNGGRGYGGSSQVAAQAGYPAISVPAGYVSDLPVGITLVGGAWTEAMLVRVAYAFEQATRVWHPPHFIPYS